jgi:D-alanyl-D-alanine carboxypeptidase
MTIDQRIEAYMATHRVPGLSVCVVKGGEPVLSRGYGWASLELATPASASTVYEIASLTKTFTALAILLLEQDGALSLADPVGEHLPGLPPAWQGITLLHLVTHTSGIPDYTGVPEYWHTTRLDVPREAMLDLVRGLPLQFAPGSGWAYSSTGYHLLGDVIERHGGAGYGEFLRSRVLGPLGMRQTRMNDPYAVVPERAAGYAWRDGAHRNKEYYSPSGTYAAGALLSSVADLALWERAFSTGVLLRDELRERIWSPGRKPTPAERAGGFTMGLGWYLFSGADGVVMRHNGSIRGFASEMARYSPAGITVALCCNAEAAGPLHELADQVAAVYSRPSG